MQAEMEFPTTAPINIQRLTKQNRRLYDYLAAGGKIHCFHPIKKRLNIGYLNSRVSDLVNKYHVPIKKRKITVKSPDGDMVGVKEYSLPP